MGVLYLLWKSVETKKNLKTYSSYLRLQTLASGFDEYKKQNGLWPTNIMQLVEVRPDLGNDATDAYCNIVILIPFSEVVGFGQLISYGRDGKPGGDNQFDRDIVLRFPLDNLTNTEWNNQVSTRFKSREARGKWWH